MRLAQTDDPPMTRTATSPRPSLCTSRRVSSSLPDVRLEIEYPDGSVRTADLELVTEHYHRGHLGGKAAAGFRMYGGRTASPRGGTPQDPHVIGSLLR